MKKLPTETYITEWPQEDLVYWNNYAISISSSDKPKAEALLDFYAYRYDIKEYKVYTLMISTVKEYIIVSPQIEKVKKTLKRYSNIKYREEPFTMLIHDSKSFFKERMSGDRLVARPPIALKFMSDLYGPDIDVLSIPDEKILYFYNIDGEHVGTYYIQDHELIFDIPHNERLKKLKESIGG